MMRNKRILLFLLLNLLPGFVRAEENAPLAKFPPIRNEEFSTDGEEDSLAIYKALKTEENLYADYRPNVTGMIFGGVYVGLGSGFLTGGIGLLSSFTYDENCYRLLGATFIVVAIPFYLVGVPILISNIYEYNVRKGHANRRDEYIDAFKRYKEKRESGSVEWLLVPSVNLANAGGGLNLLVAF